MGGAHRPKKGLNNLDLFRVSTLRSKHKREHRVRVAFWRISRQYNNITGGFAGTAARDPALGFACVNRL
ncbi:hypothetical protein PAXRUDRAFT_825397 [Paxillus rubicundulus Ve08.2h10]|uniref:Uncharacterized protein n=1 Tax=Paxillus rubicundulus Ve08.2h10 TaxID=930991 RepID=A0A0D0EB08_9AGAM|nr:hypothetical protein PAXRUDRAFT_825397 [Paxillus rubicundulus Ve08.2h10]